MVLLVFSLGIGACDPCRQLAEQICNCRTDEEKKLCINDLSLAGQHQYFKNAKDSNVCEMALKNCDCPKLNNAEDAECGMYRLSVDR